MKEDAYINYLKNKIAIFFNLAHKKLDTNYIKAIINTSYNISDCVFLLVKTFNESAKPRKTESELKKFAEDLAKERQRFSTNKKVAENAFPLTKGKREVTTAKGKEKNEEKGKEEKKTIEKEKGEKKQKVKEQTKKKEEEKKKEKQKGNEQEHDKDNAHCINVIPWTKETVEKNVNSKGKPKYLDKKYEIHEYKKNEKNEKNEKNIINKGSYTHIHKTVATRAPLKIPTNATEEKYKNKLNGLENAKRETNEFMEEKEIRNRDRKSYNKNINVNEITFTSTQQKKEKQIKRVDYMKNDILGKMTKDETKSEAEDFNYFLNFVDLEKTRSLKYVIGLIQESEGAKKDIHKNKNKCIDICVCTGKIHKLYANCLICGKVYCVRMKYTNCIYCESKLYEFSLFDKIYVQNNITDKNVEKTVKEIMESDIAIYQMYFNYKNDALKSAFAVRQRMLNNSLDDNQTRVIDDSTDWFEVDIVDEMRAQATNFRYYDDEVKNEIIEKYYEVFDKKYPEININIDFDNLNFEENEDYHKIQELKEYLKNIEKEYISNLKKDKVSGQLNNPEKYMTKKEEVMFKQLKDLKSLLLQKKNEEMEDKLNTYLNKKGDAKANAEKKKKYNVLHPSNEDTVKEEEEQEDHKEQEKEKNEEGNKKYVL